MPDLTLSSVYSFWYEYDPNILYRIVCSIESSEDWIPDSDELQEKISDLGDLLDNSLNLDLISPEIIVTLLTSIKFSQALKIMQTLESKKSGYIAKLLGWAESATTGDSSPAKIFLRRNMVFERLQLCSRIFSQERLSLLKKCQDEL
jgi:hypothetical protein